MMKSFLPFALLLLAVNFSALAGSRQPAKAEVPEEIKKSNSVVHVFKDGDTLWFLGQLYYGNGAQFQKIMAANHLKSTEGIPDGRELKIPHPVFTPDQPGFDVRANHLRDQRAEVLSKQVLAGGDGDKVIKVVLPTQQLLQDDNNPRAGGMPVIEVKDPKATSQEKTAPAGGS